MIDPSSRQTENINLTVAPSVLQYIYLDFDGEETAYRGDALKVDRVSVLDSGISGKRAAGLADSLNARFAGRGVVFVTRRPPNDIQYSTIFVGKTSAFDQYGSFAGLSETVDEGNLNRSDNAFVLLDAASSEAELADVIAHEAEHLLGTLDHGGDGLARYAYDYYYNLVSFNWTYGYSDIIANGNVYNASNSTLTHNLTYYVYSSYYGSYIKVKSYSFSTGKPGSTVSHPQPAVQTILSKLGITFTDNNPITYSELYDKTFTVRESWYASSGGKRVSDDYATNNKLTVIPSGLLLLKASSLATGAGQTSYQNAVVKKDEKSLSGLTIGAGGTGNLVISFSYSSILSDSLITKNGRVELEKGCLSKCTVEQGGVVSLSEYAAAFNSTINKDGTIYCSGDWDTGLGATTINTGGKLVADGCTVRGLTINENGQAILGSQTALEGIVSVKNTGCLTIQGQLTMYAESSCDLILDIQGASSSTTAMVNGLKYLSTGTTITLNASANPKEGTYLLATGLDTKNMPQEIHFTVNNNSLTKKEQYENQYTFVWDSDQKKYTGVNYNGYNYVLSTDGGNLNLSVVKNKQNVYLYVGKDAASIDITDLELELFENLKVERWNDLVNRNDVNVYVFSDYAVKKDELDVYIGTSAINVHEFKGEIASGRMGTLTSFLDLMSNPNETSNTLIIGAHGGGNCFSPDETIAVSNLSSLKKYNISVLAMTPCCLMGGIELAYSCKDAFDYVVATESVVTGLFNDPDYEEMIKDLLSINPNNSSGIACSIQGNIPISVVGQMSIPQKLGIGPDSSTVIVERKTSTLFNALNAFAEKANHFPVLFSYFLEARNQAKNYHKGNARIDVKDFMRQVIKYLPSFGDPNTISEIKALCNKVIEAVMSCIETTSDKYGLSCYMPISGSFSGSYPAKLKKTEWGEFIKNLYDYAMGNPLSRKTKKDSAMEEVEAFNGQSASVTGNFSKGVTLEGETAAGPEDARGYMVNMTKTGAQDDAIRVSSEEETPLSVDLYNKTGELIRSGTSDSGATQLSLNGLQPGEYFYSVSAEEPVAFDIEYQSSTDTGKDHLDVLFEHKTKESALTISEGYYKGLVAGASNPDWYFVDTASVSASPGIIGIWGKDIVSGSVSASAGGADGSVLRAYVEDEGTGEEVSFDWNPESGMYEAYFSGYGYLYVAGQKASSTGYNLFVTSEDNGSSSSHFDSWAVDFDVTVEGKTSMNFAAIRLNPGIFTITGEFAEGLNATISVIDFITGKSVGSIQVKNGRIAKETSFLLNGSYLLSVAGDGKSSGDCLILIEGTTNNAADNSDDTIDYVRDSAGLNFVSGSLGYGDAVDWILTDIGAAGRYTISLSGLDAAAKATVTLWSSIDGGAAKKVASQSATGKDVVLSDLLLPCDDHTEYFVSVTCDNASSGVFTNYDLSISGDVYNSLLSDNSDDVYSHDLDEIAFRTGTRTDAATGAYLKSATVDGWVGYGDFTDVLPFTVETAAQWGFSLKADTAGSVSMTLQSVATDSSGASKYTQIAAGKAGADGVIQFSSELQAGTYFLTVSANDQQTDRSNTDYTVTLDEKARHAVLDTSTGAAFSLAKGETKTFTLTSLMQVSFNKTANMSLWTGDGKNGMTTIKPSYNKSTKTYDALLTPGTYFLTASKAIYDVCVIGTYPDDSSSTFFNDCNTFADAEVFFNQESGFVGYGDGVDYYRFTVGGGYYAPGDYTFQLGDAVSKCASLAVYAKTASKGKTTYKQLGKITHKTGESTPLTIKSMLDGEYYLKVESLSYAKDSSAKNTSYKLSIGDANRYRELKLDDDLGSLDSVLAKGDYAFYQGTGDGSGVTVYKIGARVENGYNVYVNSGDGKLVKVNTYNNTFILRDDRLFYVKSTKDSRNFSQGISLTEVAHREVDFFDDWCIDLPGEDNLQRFGSFIDDDFRNGWSGEIGSLQAEDSLSFTIGEGGMARAGWGEFEIASINRLYGDTSAIKLTLCLEKLKDGSWEKVSSVTAQSAYDTKTRSFVLSGQKIETAIEDYSKYRIRVSVPEKDAEKFLGRFTVQGSIDAFTPNDASLADPTILSGNVAGTVVKNFDDTDVYELGDIDMFYLNMDSGSVKLTFYDGDFNPVALTGNYLTGTTGTPTASMKNAISATLNAGDAKSDGFRMAASDLLDYGICFARIDALGKANNHYHIATGPA